MNLRSPGVVSSLLATALVVLAACKSTPPQPTPTPDPVPTTPVTITFSGLASDGTSVAAHSESGFTVTVTAASWVSDTLFGNPAPFMFFNSPAGVSTAGEFTVRANGAFFLFTSVDLYSSTTPIPFSLTGSRGANQSFALDDTLTAAQLGNTFGNFATVLNAQPNVLIDALRIRLTNPAFPCCSNRMGLDNIVLKR